MNLILLEEDDLLEPERVRLSGRRFRHVVDVLRAGEGDELAVGMLNSRKGKGRIIRLGERSLDLAVSLEREPPAGLPALVILALPRPKALRRALSSLAQLGVKRIVLLHAARVEKSYWQTPFLEPPSIRGQLLLGLEQSGDTMLPEVLLRRRFRPFAEDELPGLCAGSLGLVGHPRAAVPCPRDVRQPVTLVIGPEGGFVPFELELLRAQGFLPVSLGPRIMTVENAVPFLLARLF